MDEDGDTACVNVSGREGDCHTEVTDARERGRGQRQAQRRWTLLTRVCYVHSYIQTLITQESMSTHSADTYRVSTFRLFLSELTDHLLQKSGLTSCLGWRAMGEMLLEEHKLVSCQRSQFRNDACLASLGISGNHSNCLTAGPVKSSSTKKMSVFQTHVALCCQDPELS